MLAARKKVYTEAIELTARKKHVKRIVPKASAQPVPKLKILSVAIIAVLVFTACVAISRFAQISRNHGQIMSLERDLRLRQNTAELLELELTARKDLSRIERIAATEIGMKYPDEAQVQYVVLPEAFDDKSNEPSETRFTAESGNSVWERILRLLIP